MPCIKCNNGKWKYGQHGNCVFNTLEACKKAEAAIHAQNNPKSKLKESCGCSNKKLSKKNYE